MRKQTMLKTHERIITVQDLAKKTQKAVANAQQQPLVVTADGRPTAYLISVELFDALLAQLETADLNDLAASIAIGEQQFAQGAYKTLEEAVALAEATWQDSPE